MGVIYRRISVFVLCNKSISIINYLDLDVGLGILSLDLDEMDLYDSWYSLVLATVVWMLLLSRTAFACSNSVADFLTNAVMSISIQIIIKKIFCRY